LIENQNAMARQLPANYFCGLSGIELPIPKYQFPEPFQKSSRLTYYASLFNSIEVNSTFYKIPKPSTISRWRSEVPDDFIFTFKLFQDLTHNSENVIDKDVVKDFVHSIDHVEEKRGCILVQFPPSYGGSNIHDVSELLSVLREVNKHSWHVAVEFRNTTWYNDEVFDMLREQNVALVLQDMPRSATPFIVTADSFVYVRFHGPTGNYRGSYTDNFLQEYAGYIREWLSENKTVYVYFNNTAGEAFNNLQTLNRILIDHS
jgi:uncharacterized protein YecE (DUF72 family)